MDLKLKVSDRPTNSAEVTWRNWLGGSQDRISYTGKLKLKVYEI